MLVRSTQVGGRTSGTSRRQAPQRGLPELQGRALDPLYVWAGVTREPGLRTGGLRAIQVVQCSSQSREVSGDLGR